MAYFLLGIMGVIVVICVGHIIGLKASVDTLEKDVENLKKNKQDIMNCNTCKHKGSNSYCLLHPNPHVSMSYLFCVDKGYKYWESKR